MRRVVVLGLSSIGIVAASFVSPSAAASTAATPPRVTIFGDSVPDSLQYVPDARKLLGSGLDLRLEIAPCRRLVAIGCPYQGKRPESVLDIVQFSPIFTLGNVVVVDVGYNEPAINYGTDMSQVAIALVKLGVEHVLWVTMREQTDNYRQINDVIRTQARRWPQLQIVEWDAASRGQDWFQADGVHLNADGALGLAKLLRANILAACGPECQSALPPAAELPKNVRRPRVVGTPIVGHRLVCLPGTWTGTRPIAFSYRWVRDQKIIPHAFRQTRAVRAADARHLLTCRVWAANAAGATNVTARPVHVRTR